MVPGGAGRRGFLRCQTAALNPSPNMLSRLTAFSKIIFALTLLALAGMLAFWWSTPYGLGLVNDTASYVEGAANLLAGKGFVHISGGGELTPITHFPPLFSLALAGFGLAGMDLLAGARLLITFLFGLDILLVGLTIYKISRSALFALFGAAVLAFSDVHLGVYSFALSEPLFLTLMLVVFLCLAKSYERREWYWSVLTGFFLSLAYLTRYAGVSLFITILLAAALLPRPLQAPRKESRLLDRSPYREILLILSGALPPVLAWNLYSLAQTGALSNRLITWHPAPFQVWFEALKNLLTWAAPDDLLSHFPLAGRLLSLFSLLLLPGLLSWLVWVISQTHRKTGVQRQGNNQSVLAFSLALQILVYLGFLVISISLVDAATPLNDRILSVIYLPEMILFACGLAWVWKALSGRVAILRWGIGLFCALFLIFSVKDGLSMVQQLSTQGQGFAHQGWQASQTIQAIQRLPEITLYSNKPTAIYLLTGRSAYNIPTPTDSATGLSRSSYASDRDLIQQRVQQGEALLVLFGLRDSQAPDEVLLFKDLSAGLPVLADYGDGVIFGIAP